MEDIPLGNFSFCLILILQIVSIAASFLKLKSMAAFIVFPIHVEAGKKYILVSLLKLYCFI
jgi:hypothetical protein